MDLIGSIQYLGNSLAGRKTSQGKEKPAKKNGEKKNPADEQHSPSGTRLGQKIDTTA
jgi:hypothetical protein